MPHASGVATVRGVGLDVNQGVTLGGIVVAIDDEEIAPEDVVVRRDAGATVVEVAGITREGRVALLHVVDRDVATSDVGAEVVGGAFSGQ